MKFFPSTNCDNPDYLFKSSKFLTMINPSILEIRYNEMIFMLLMKLPSIWENLLKWACGQYPGIQQYINKWNKNEYTVMERRINRLIRFYHISSEDFLYPYKKLLPNDLTNNIFAYHMVPSKRQKNII
jgi:hypothetical protein